MNWFDIFFKLIIINCIAIDIIFALPFPLCWPRNLTDSEIKRNRSEASSKWNKCKIYVGDQLDRCRWMEQTQGNAWLLLIGKPSMVPSFLNRFSYFMNWIRQIPLSSTRWQFLFCPRTTCCLLFLNSAHALDVFT
jgi:hypothetical protein